MRASRTRGWIAEWNEDALDFVPSPPPLEIETRGLRYDPAQREWVQVAPTGAKLAQLEERGAARERLHAKAPTIALDSNVVREGARRHGVEPWLDAMLAQSVDPRSRPVIPSSVLACIAGSWGHLLHDPASGETRASEFRCRSWRCPRCGGARNRAEYLRLRAAVDRRDLRDLSFLTFTFSRRRFSNPHAAARGACGLWQSMLDRLRYQLAKRLGCKVREVPIGYYLVFEQHKKPDRRGFWLHAHVLVNSRELAEWIRELGRLPETFDAVRRTLVQPWRFSSNVLAPIARAAGWGRVDAQPVDGEGMAEYLSKRASWCAAELGGGASKNQSPTHAPRNFRRIRTSRGFLAKIERVSKGLVSAVTAAPPAIVAEVLRHCPTTDLCDQGQREAVLAVARDAYRRGWASVLDHLETLHPPPAPS